MSNHVAIIHPFPVAVVVVASTALFAIVHRSPIEPADLAGVAIVVLLSQIPVGALNDYLDRELDRVAGRRKPVATGDVSPRFAVWLTAVSLCLLIPAAAHFGTFSLALVCFGTAGGLAYDLVLKQTRWSLLGYLVGFLSLLTWIWQVAGHLTLRLVLIYPLAAFLIVAAHLAQTYPDIESDQLAGHRNLAVALGVEITSILVCGFTTVLSMAALMAAIVARLGFAGALGGAAFILAAIIWLMRPASLERRDVRVTMFHLAAPAAALAAASLVLTLRDIAF